MITVKQAKRRFLARYRHEEGLVGVGISQLEDGFMLRVYVVDQQVPIVKELTKEGNFDGFPLEIVISGRIEAAGS